MKVRKLPRRQWAAGHRGVEVTKENFEVSLRPSLDFRPYREIPKLYYIVPNKHSLYVIENPWIEKS